MSLTNSSYFVGEYKIQNLSTSSSGVAAAVVAVTTADLDWFIDKYEPIYLKMVMGDDMYDEFIAGLAADPIDAKWTALRDKLIDSTKKISPIVAYIWYAYKHDKLTHSSEMGELKPNTENASIQSATRKMIDAWNDSMKGAYDVAVWLTENYATYPTQDIDFNDFYTLNDFGI